MSAHPLFQVDAFTAEAFGGNPAAVCVLDDEMPASWMQAVAMEMNLSETAFVRPVGDGWSLRWFTPKIEVALCGHATLATAHVLLTRGYADATTTIEFATASGTLRAVATDEGISLDFPRRELSAEDAPAEVLAAVGVTPVATVRAATGPERGDDWIVELADEAAVRELAPALAGLRRLGAPSFMVTARGTSYDCVSRFFGPAAGIDEDPVTGSAHCALGPYWADKLGKTQLRAFQASPRGGEIGVTVGPTRVGLAGRAVTVLEGTLRV